MPNLDEATTLTVSNVKRIVFTDQPSFKEETCAIQLLAEKGFDVILNPNLIFLKEKNKWKYLLLTTPL